MNRKGWVLWASGIYGWRLLELEQEQCQRSECRSDLFSVARSFAKPELLEQKSSAPAVSLKLELLESFGWSDPAVSKDEARKKYRVNFSLDTSGSHPRVLVERWFVHWGCHQGVLDLTALRTSLGQRKFLKLSVSQERMKLKVFSRTLDYWAGRSDRTTSCSEIVSCYLVAHSMPDVSQLGCSPSGMLQLGCFWAPGGVCVIVKRSWHGPPSLIQSAVKACPILSLPS